MEGTTYQRNGDWPALATGDGRAAIAQALFEAVPGLERVTLTIRQWMVLEVWTPGFDVPEAARRAVKDVLYPGLLVLYNSGFKRGRRETPPMLPPEKVQVMVGGVVLEGYDDGDLEWPR